MFKFAQALCALAVAAGGLQAQTVSISSTARTFGMVGIVAGQTARLNVLNYGVVTPTPTSVTAGCAVTLKIVDSNGKTLASKTVTVVAGTSTYLDYSPAFATAVPQRLQIRGEVDTPAAVPATATGQVIPVMACSLLPTFEIYDNVGQKTELVMQ